MTTSDADGAARRARRAFIRAHHPDVGGDPDDFATGLAAFTTSTASSGPSRPPVTAFRRRGVGRSVARSVREIRRRLAGRPARRLL